MALKHDGELQLRRQPGVAGARRDDVEFSQAGLVRGREFVSPAADGVFSFSSQRAKRAALAPDTELQPHQQRLVDRMRRGDDRMLLYWGLGSGKSLGALAAAEAANKPYVAAVPAALRENFRKERARWTDSETPADVISYTGLANGRAPAVEPGTLILDELQRVRNPATAQARAVAGLARRSKGLLALSGSPIVNSPGDLAMPLNLLAGTKYTPESFEDEFVRTEKVSPGLIGRLRGATPGEVQRLVNEKKLRKLLRNRVDYEPARDPEGVSVRDETVDVQSTPEQRDFVEGLYGRLPWHLRAKVRHRYPLSQDDRRNLLSFMVGPRQAGLSMYPFTGGDPAAAMASSGKLTEAARRLEETLKDPRAKALVYSNFPRAGLEPYEAYLRNRGIPAAMFRGGLSDAERKRVVDDYNADKLRVLLLGPAAAEGISTKGTNLIQLLDPHFNAARLDQARGRGLRHDSHEGLPQDLKNVRVERYVAHSPERTGLRRILAGRPMPTADEVLAGMAKEKQDVNEQFLRVLREVGGEKRGGDWPAAAPNPGGVQPAASGMLTLANSIYDRMPSKQQLRDATTGWIPSIGRAATTLQRSATQLVPPMQAVIPPMSLGKAGGEIEGAGVLALARRYREADRSV